MSAPFDFIADPAVRRVFEERHNYRAACAVERPRTACLYFSSHGLYFPNTAAEFERAVVLGDRYEWERHPARRIDKHVYVRDVRKQWYLGGISAGCDSVEKVADLLRRETEGMRVTAIGSSAGGYAAALFGCLVDAATTIVVNGQFDLSHVLADPSAREVNRIVAAASGGAAGRWLDLKPLLEAHRGAIYYFHSARCPADVRQAEIVRGVPAVRAIRIDSAVHGVPFFSENLHALLGLPDAELEELPRERIVHPIELSVRLDGAARTGLHVARWIAGRLLGRGSATARPAPSE